MQEPSCLPKVRKELQAYDRRLDVVWNRERNLWEVREKGFKTSKWHHVFFWGNGHWSELTYRQLPESAKPLIERLVEMDTARYGKYGAREMISNKGLSAKRAQAIERRRIDWRERLLEYRNYMTPSKMTELNRKYVMGGNSRREANKARADAINEILVPDDPHIIPQ